jgi:hypothetical protein
MKRSGMPVSLAALLGKSMTRKFPATSFCLLALLTGLATRSDAGSIVSDGGFEIPTPGVPYTGSLGDGWFATSETIATYNASDGSPAVPHSGSQFVYLGWSGLENTVSQTLTTVAGQSYLISYWVADNAADVFGASFGSQVLYNGTTPTNGVTSASDYVNYTYTETATSNATVLSFDGYITNFSIGAYGPILDDVSVTAVSTTPEPGSLGLTAAVLLALCLVRGRFLETAAPRH